MQPADSLAPPSFAGLLAALATPARAKAPDEDDGLADDIAELSYEGALRHRASGKVSSGSDRAKGSESRGAKFNPEISAEPFDAEFAASAVEPAGSSERISITEADLRENERRGKNDRVTLRLNRSECMQLRARAAESGLTISAYLRTCILEVETLRTLVKEAVARMRTPEVPGPPQTAQVPPKFGPSAAQRWRAKIFPHRTESKHAERA